MRTNGMRINPYVHSQAQLLFYIPSEHDIPERPKFGEKYQHYIDVHRQVLPTPRSTTTAATAST